MAIVLYHEIAGRKEPLATLYDKRYIAMNFHLKTADNDSGQLSFCILKSNPEYPYMQHLVSELIIESNGSEIWRGRYLSDNEDLGDFVSITAAGPMDYLRDTVQDSKTFENTPAKDIFTHIIAGHNARPIEARKKFIIGRITVDRSVEEFKLSPGEKSWNALKRLINVAGGKILVRREDGVFVVDWLKEYTHICSQKVRIGRNLLDASRSSALDSIATVLYLYGKTVDDIETTVASVNNGQNYIVNDEAKAAFGWIEDSYRDSSVDDPQMLLERGKEELAKKLEDVTSIKITALDLSSVDSVESIEVGMLVNAEVHGKEYTLPCTEADRYFWEPTKSKFNLGASFKALSAMIGGKE